MSNMYIYPNNLDLDGKDMAIVFDDQAKITRPIKWVDTKSLSVTERQMYDLVRERHVKAQN